MKDDDLIFKRCVTIRAIPDGRGRLQPKEFLDDLALRDRRRADAGFASFDIGFESKRGFAGRLEKVEGSTSGLLELKLTRGGTPGPQLRMVGVWRRGTFYVARGFKKTSRAIPRREVAAAESIIARWTEDPRREGGRRRT